MLDVIQALLLNNYSTGSILIFLKQCSFSDLSMTVTGSFSLLSILVQTITANLSEKQLSPIYDYCVKFGS